MYPPTRGRIERQGLIMLKQNRLRKCGITPALADAAVCGGLTFTDLTQPPPREDRNVKFEDSAWFDAITAWQQYEDATDAFVNNTCITSSLAIKQLFETGRLQKPILAPLPTTDSSAANKQKRHTRAQRAAQSATTAQNDIIRETNRSAEAAVDRDSQLESDLDQYLAYKENGRFRGHTGRIQLFSELARWIMGKQVCALEENGRRWITHDAGDLDVTYSVGTFVVARPIFVHPLTEHTHRKLSYFEVEVVGGASVGIGSRIEHTSARCHIGWESSSYGYHSIDGSKWSDYTGEPYALRYGGEACEPYDDFCAPRTGEGDFVGCGVDFETREVFFTLNGNMLGVAYRHVDLFDEDKQVQLHPCVASEYSVAPGESAQLGRFRINFGDEPFKFDFMAYREVELPPPDPSKQQPVLDETLNADGEPMTAEEETFDIVYNLVLCCFDAVMTDAQKEALGVGAGHQHAAFEAATTMIEAEYDVWPEWLKQHFQSTEQHGIDPRFEVAIFEQWLEENEQD